MPKDPTFLVVKLQNGLTTKVINEVWAGIHVIPGIESTSDLSSISQETLDLILRRP